MAELLLAVGAMVLGLAGLLWWEGTSWGALIAWFLAMWAAMFAAWGLVALHPPKMLACLAAIVLGAGSTILGVLFVTGGWWPWGIGCVIGGALGVAGGGWRVRRLVIRDRRS